MLDCIIKTCKKIHVRKNVNSKFLNTLSLFILGLEYTFDYIKNDKFLYNVFINFDSFINENISKFIKIIVTSLSVFSISPVSVSNYFYKNLLHDKNIGIDYNIILSLLLGDEKITAQNIMYISMSDRKHFIPLFYHIIKNKNLLM